MLARLGIEELHDLTHELVQIRRLEQRRLRAGEGEEVADQGADPIELGEHQVAKRRPELLVVLPLREELDEGPDGDEGVADLVCDPRGERAEGREPIGADQELLGPGQLAARRGGIRECGARSLCDALGERQRGRRERRTAGPCHEQEPPPADRQHGAPGTATGLRASAERIGTDGPVEREGHHQDIGKIRAAVLAAAPARGCRAVAVDQAARSRRARFE